MGVPKFFRYTSERYPCLNELVKQHQIPEFDNMYLDMNGIIHNCSHPDDSNPHFRITEEKIFADIFHYLTVLFQIIKPKKLFFMAIDGVAPRAKMNQQRGRRFRSAREAEMQEEKAREAGEKLPEEKRFDSNCITPGTVFMARLHEQLRYFVKQKISTDPLWSKCKVILSGHETPGEGEHKIMDYIRWARSQPDYDPDTRHCLYGLDADLIMLGMCTHEPHFALLREEVKFGKSTSRATSPEETNFFLLHLSLMRNYLEQEFLSVKDSLSFEWDMEKIIDDWVLMGFLVGNDFIPNLPNMHISNDALPVLYKAYMAVLPTLDGYINEAGILNLARFEKFMQELAKIDTQTFQETYVDLRYFQEKTGRRPNLTERTEYKRNDDETFNVDLNAIKSSKNDDLQALINATDDLFKDVEDDDDDYEDISDEEANFLNEFTLHKEDYYMNKLDYAKVTPEVLASQAECYVRAIQWNLHYYYRGCASWCWFYPHHYAPFMSDIKGFTDLKIEFELGTPFKPFEQLLAVLPAASRELLPTPFHTLMTDDASPIFNYYPIEFETDLNGKKNDWEAVVLIPFIDEKKLLGAMEPCYKDLTPEEIKRNTHGPMMTYNYSQQSLGVLEAPQYFPTIANCHCTETAVWRDELDVPPEQLRCGMLPNAHKEFYFLGFPTLKHLPYKTYLKKNKVKVFDQPSRNENMIVELINKKEEPAIETVVNRLLGKVIWVGWPHLQQAKVMSISNESQRYHLSKDSDVLSNSSVDENNSYLGFTIEKNVGYLQNQWFKERATIVDHNMNRLGLEIGDVNIIVHAVNLKGYKYVTQNNTSLAIQRVWCDVPCGYAYQTVLEKVECKMPELQRYALPQEVYPPGADVFLMTGPPYYGCMAQVISSEDVARSGRIKVLVTTCEEPRTNTAPMVVRTEYKPAGYVAASTGVTPQLLSRLSGAVLLVLGNKHTESTDHLKKINIGLNLKFNKKNQEVVGYTRRCPATNQWLYSNKCKKLIEDYADNFPDVINMMSFSSGNDIFFESDIWPGQVGKGKPQELIDWLKKQPHNNAARRDCGSEGLEPEELVSLAKSIDSQLEDIRHKSKTATLHVKISLLYKSSLYKGNIQPDPQADYQMYDRVVCASSNLTVPMGAKGTITAIYRPGITNTVRLSDKMNSESSYQILFDEPFPGALNEELFPVPRFYRLSGCHLINISYGRKIRESRKQEPIDVFQPQILRNNELRPNDGHHSAFASYSPTKDRQTPKSPEATPKPDYQASTTVLKSLLKIQPENEQKKQAPHSNNHYEKQNFHDQQALPAHNNHNKNAIRNEPNYHAPSNSQDNSTTMLKSLLKIDKQTSNNSNQGAVNQQNWRSQEPRPTPPGQPPSNNQRQKQPVQNWRNECTVNQQPRNANWNPTYLQNRPQHINQGQPMGNMMRVPMPGAGGYAQRPPLLPTPPAFHRQPIFPLNVPSTIMPNFFVPRPNEVPKPNNLMGGPTQAANPPPANQEPPRPPPTNQKPPNPPPQPNPFVPLQVVAKQRRSQNVSAPAAESTDRPIKTIQKVEDVELRPSLVQNQHKKPQSSSGAQETKKQVKVRIAANIPGLNQ